MYPETFDFSVFADMSGLENTVLIVFLIVYLLALLLSLVWSITVYVLSSLGLYQIAKRRGVHHSWMSWLPIVNTWVLGSVSDQYQYVVKGRITNRRKTLLGLSIAAYVTALAMSAAMLWFNFRTIADPYAMSSFDPLYSMSAGTISAILVFGVIWLVTMVLSTIQSVFAYISYYDLFRSCNPGNAVVFLVLSIFFNFLLPFFVFANRKKDEGMPPRKVPVVELPWHSAVQTAAPNWNAAQQPEETVPTEEPIPAEETEPAEE